MAITYLKRASKTPETHSKDVAERVQQLLDKIKADRESGASRIAEELDGWTEPILMPYQIN